jgi:endo-1,4-beta-mannosidase
MPTRKGGPRPRQRIEPAEKVDAAVPVEAAEQTAPTAAGEPAAAAVATGQPATKAPRRNPLFPVGTSLYAYDDEFEHWDNWYARDLDDDLGLLAEARFALTRIFVSWKVIEPQVAQYDDDALQRLADIVRAARAKKLQVIVCLFGDDRHAELLDVPWGKKRDPRTDAYLIQRELALVQKVVGQLRADAGVFAWQLGNEAFLSGFTEKSELDEWVMLVREAVRELDPDRPMTLGIDAETFFRGTGVDARDAVNSCEFAVSHVTAAYRAYAAEGPITSGPSTYLESFLLRTARGSSGGTKPVLLDDVGTFSLDFSAAEEASAMRTALWSGLANRAAGALTRRLRDMSTERREPYFLDPFEVLVGLVGEGAELKPSFVEANRFVRAAARIDLKAFVASPERTAVIMPSERFNALPDLASLFDPRACFSAFIGAKEAHLPVAVIHEEDEFTEHSVLFLPSAFNLADETWERLAAFVQGGGALVLSYGGGDAHPGIRDLFGVEFRGDAGPRSVLSCRVAQDDMLGALESFDAHFEVSNFALLSGGIATVVATDEKGSPLLTVNQLGQGRAVYIATPLERAIAQGDPWATPAPVRHLLREVYGAVARAAGCGAAVGCDVPEVEVALFQGESEDVVVLVNHAPFKVMPTLTVDRRIASITDVRGGTPIAVGGATFGVGVEHNGVLALRLSYA